MAGKWFPAGACAPDGLFLGLRFVPQKPVYLHHRLRRQLAQHLEGKAGVEGTVHAGSPKTGMGFGGGGQGSSAAEPGGGEKSLALSPRNLSPLRSERTL